MSGRAEPRPDQGLRALLRELAAEDLPGVIEAARADARARARAVLADALTEELLSSASAPAPPPREPQRGEALYVLCILEAGAELPADVRGIGDAPLELITHDELAAVVCPVPLAEFGEDALREHLGNMPWLERTARAHEMALEAIGARATLVPLRLCTVFHGENGVRDLLHREAERLTAALAHLSGRREWGVKAFAAEAPPEAAAEPSSGSGYLRQRQHERDRRTRRAETVAGACEAIHDQLAELADDARSNPPQRPEVSGGPHPMVLNGAYLVADDGFEEFLERTEALRAQYAELGLELELTGPWPAYNFIPDAIGVA